MRGEPAEWPVRVFDAADPDSGAAGFLIAADTVMTCAHVVDGMAEPTVRFSAGTGLDDQRARVIARGGWRPGGDDHGDVAVLELPSPVGLEPAAFAPQNALDLPADLAVLGFPRRRRDERSRVALVHVSSRLLPIEEWIQLESNTSFGPAVEHGYSGSAVTIRDTGAVVGMVTSADPRERISLMLPSRRLALHWPGLLEHVPLGPLTPRLHRDLRAMLAGIDAGLARGVAARALLATGGPELDSSRLAGDASAYQIAAHLAESLFAFDSDDRIAGTLAAFCREIDAATEHAGASADLRRWWTEHQPGKAAAPAGPVVVSVSVGPATAGVDQAMLSVQLWSADDLLDEAFREVVPQRGVRATVEGLLFGVIEESILPATDVLVEFVLPARWLAKPVERWRLRPGGTELGWRYPVVVRDQSRSRSAAPSRDHQARTQRLSSAGLDDDGVLWTDCLHALDQRRLDATLAGRPELVLVGFRRQPRAPALLALGANGVPAAVWRRRTCARGDCPSGLPCHGTSFQRALRDEMTGPGGPLRAADLPGLLWRLRSEAGADESHPFRSMTLLWEPAVSRRQVSRLGMARYRP
ncbi:trypsin-like peptidase domain-containing protein [Actinoplanes sp. NPDC026623]|uniref:VMAP-C domain-containing protein n=1 Tax=Actinoplanes sp. NPDC026623 TaxID=3155610 RepID=UPI0033E43320